MSLPVFALRVNAAPTAKVVCDKATKTATFYYDAIDHGSEANGVFEVPKTVGIDGNDTTAPWFLYFKGTQDTHDLQKVVFDKSFYNYKPTNTGAWFCYCKSLKSIEGMENLDTSMVTMMTAMFDGCTSLTELDLSHFDTSKVTSMRWMFGSCNELQTLNLSSFDITSLIKSGMDRMFINCSELKTIWVSDTWSINSIDNNSEYVFSGCTNLVGGAGTKCKDPSFSFAHIDGGEDNPGYLTEAPKYTVTFDLNGGGLQKDQPAAQTRYQFQKVSNPGIEGVLGWYTDAACSDSNKWNFERNIVTEDITLHAKWKPEPTHNFTDVNYERWMGPAINYVDAYGLMKGTTDTTFEPNTLCSRAMLVQILYNAEKSPSVDGWKNPFKDVPANKWYTNAVIWAVNVGATKGISDGQFGVENELTREQVAQFFYNYAALCNIDVSASVDLSAFKDAGEISGWARDSMKWAKAVGLMAGSKDKNGNTILNPKGKATRAEVAQMIMNYMENVLER